MDAERHEKQKQHGTCPAVAPNEAPRLHDTSKAHITTTIISSLYLSVATRCSTRHPTTESKIQGLLVSIAVSSLRLSTAKNASYMGASQLIILVLNFVTLTVLANLLSTEDMGIIGIALVFMSLLYNVHDFGIISAVVQRDARVDDSIAAAITLRWAISVVVIASTLVLAPLLTNYVGVPALGTVLPVLCFNLVALNFAFPPQAIMTRKLSLSLLAVANGAH